MNKYANIIIEELSGKIAKDHAIEIAKYHRVQASPGFHAAAVYVQEELRKMEIKNALIEKFPADGKTMYWTHNAVISWWATQGELRMVEPEDELLGRFEEVPMILATHSKSADVVAEVIDIGEGNQDKDYEQKDVKGKIALASGNARSTHLKAVEHGAMGTIHHPPWDRAALFPDLVQYNGIWPDQKTRDKTTFGFCVSDRQYQKIKKILDSGKTVKVSCKTDAKLYDGSIEVLTAEFTGTQKPEEIIVLCAHLCHPKTCTNDNASGSAVLMEIARSMTSLIQSGRIQPPKRTIRFMWVPEINGTYAWMHSHQDELKNIHVAINLDMVGEHPVTVGWALNLVSAPDSTPSYLNPLLADLLKDVADDRRGVAIEGWPYGLDYRVEPFAGGSDHVCFNDAAFGIPSVMFYNPDHFHHTSFDDASRLDSSKMKRVGTLVASAALTIANADYRTALDLADLTFSHGCRRLAETGSRILRKLLSADSKDKNSDNVGTIYLRGIKMLDESSRRETKAVESATRLSSAVSEPLKDMEKTIETLAKAEKDKLRGIYELLGKEASMSLICGEQDKEILETQKLIPRRTFEGPSRGIRPDEIQSEDDRKWLEEFNSKHMAHKNYFLPLGGMSLELINMADGKRSIYDISIAASAEFDDTDPLEVKRFFDVHKTAGKIAYV